ncbi:hypothetical protein AgCh_037859 [Apium graveolens]
MIEESQKPSPLGAGKLATMSQIWVDLRLTRLFNIQSSLKSPCSRFWFQWTTCNFSVDCSFPVFYLLEV